MIDIIKKIQRLPLDKQKEVEYIINSVIINNETLFVSKEIEQERRKMASFSKPKFWIADDFNETPADFKDYM